MDVHQLADVFESFRTMALEQDGLDPVNYVSVPGLTWDSAFRMTNSSIHLLQDSIMYEFFEAGLRGGMTFVNRHHLQRNSPDDEDFDPSLPHTELLYIDANNLYGHALSMPLPQRDFEWVEEETERHHLIQQLPSMDVRGSIGFVAEVDLVIPDHLHDVMDGLPLANGSHLTWLSNWVAGAFSPRKTSPVTSAASTTQSFPPDLASGPSQVRLSSYPILLLVNKRGSL